MLETDYLVVGAGAIGMSFVDALIEGSDADVVMIDRRHAPGGHWLDSYPFVQLHQPSMNYGVNSTPLGLDRIEETGRDTGFYERASGTEICGYYDEVMRHRLLASGRVRFFPMSDYEGDGRFRCRLTDEVTDVRVRRRVVDATYMASRVPAVDPPPFTVSDEVRWIPVGELTSVEHRPAGFVIVGGGKTGLDAACWLLDRGTPPDAITWIRPGDAWLLNRRCFQPGDGVLATLEGVVEQLEAVVACTTVTEVFETIERRGVVMRLDPNIEPVMMRGGTVSTGELEQLRRITNVVRLGHVSRVEPDEIVLDHGSIPSTPDHLVVHCAAPGLSDNPPKPIFTDDLITLQTITRVNLSLSAGLTGFLETTARTTEEKDRLCQPNPWPQTPFDWLRHVLVGMRNETAWAGEADIQSWINSSRLDLLGALRTEPDTERVHELQNRLFTALFPALEKLDTFAAAATPAERARLYQPA